MRKLFLVACLLMLGRSAVAQALLNEVYAYPGSGKNEFFEFFNTSTVPASMDGYTIVTYFEEGTQKGFYVLDLPDLTIASRGYFVGASSIPFNYQGVSGSSAAQFNWNNLGAWSGSAYLKKWLQATNVPAAIDGNEHYDLGLVPDNFNDLFARLDGGGASYVIFVYRNGQLLSVFLGGTGGSTAVPLMVRNMPALFVDMLGSATDFTIPFSSYAGTATEYVTQDIGTDNGYIRLRDGYCGVWTKSSAQVNHSPGLTNGNGGTTAATVAVYGELFRGNPSRVVYNVLNAPASAFPITMSVFVDNGSVPGAVDPGDTFVESNTEFSVADGPFTTFFTPYHANVVIQTITAAGCIDNVVALPNNKALALRLQAFTAEESRDGARLQWTVRDNEAAREFVIERSDDGQQFQPLATIAGSRLAGTESYFFTDAGFDGNRSYRIRLLAATAQPDQYSRQVTLRSHAPGGLRIEGNPVGQQVKIEYTATTAGVATLHIYSAAGSAISSHQVRLRAGQQQLSVDAPQAKGMYVLELVTPTERRSTRFLRQ